MSDRRGWAATRSVIGLPVPVGVLAGKRDPDPGDPEAPLLVVRIKHRDDCGPPVVERWRSPVPPRLGKPCDGTVNQSIHIPQTVHSAPDRGPPAPAGAPAAPAVPVRWWRKPAMPIRCRRRYPAPGRRTVSPRRGTTAPGRRELMVGGTTEGVIPAEVAGRGVASAEVSAEVVSARVQPADGSRPGSRSWPTEVAPEVARWSAELVAAQGAGLVELGRG
jgi:hypothetical protein